MVTVLNIPSSPSQLSSSTTGVPVIVVPSNDRPLGSPSIEATISASLSRLVTVAGLIGTPCVHLGLPGSSSTVSITLLSTLTSGRFSVGSVVPGVTGFSVFPLLFSTSCLSASVPDSLNVTNSACGALGFSSLTTVYLTFLLTGV